MGYSNSEVAHRFATGIGYRCTGINMFFEGDTIYSYGYHFPIAIKWKGYLLFNDDRYSNSTARHQSYVWGACSHMDMVHCATLTSDPGSAYFIEQNFKLWNDQIERLVQKMAVARKPEKWLSQILHVVGTAERFCDVFGKKLPKEFYRFRDEETVAKVKEFVKKEMQEKKERERKRTEEQIRKFHEFKTNWVSLPYQIVRYRAEKNRFETSKNVEIPFEIGKRFYEALRDGNLKVGDKVLYYRVNQVGDTLRIGCHTFKKQYLLEYGKKMFNE